MTGKIFACDFEVFGIVQGVFFRKYTQTKANEFGVRGWCRNTSEGSVAGRMEGTVEQLHQLQHWMREIGTPTSRVDKTIFSTNKEIENYTSAKFEIRK